MIWWQIRRKKTCVVSWADCFLRPGMKGSMLADNMILAVASYLFNISLKMSFFYISSNYINLNYISQTCRFFNHENREARMCVKLARGYEARVLPESGIHLLRQLKKHNICTWRTWSWVSSRLESIKRNVGPCFQTILKIKGLIVKYMMTFCWKHNKIFVRQKAW